MLFFLPLSLVNAFAQVILRYYAHLTRFSSLTIRNTLLQSRFIILMSDWCLKR